jgi:hypothetical protein
MIAKNDWSPSGTVVVPDVAVVEIVTAGTELLSGVVESGGASGLRWRRWWCRCCLRSADDGLSWGDFGDLDDFGCFDGGCGGGCGDGIVTATRGDGGVIGDGDNAGEDNDDDDYDYDGCYTGTVGVRCDGGGPA